MTLALAATKVMAVAMFLPILRGDVHIEKARPLTNLPIAPHLIVRLGRNLNLASARKLDSIPRPRDPDTAPFLSIDSLPRSIVTGRRITRSKYICPK